MCIKIYLTIFSIIKYKNVLHKYSPSSCKENTSKWYYAQFSWQKLDCNCYIFQKIFIYNGKWQINLLKLKNKYCQYKKDCQTHCYYQRHKKAQIRKLLRYWKFTPRNLAGVRRMGIVLSAYGMHIAVRVYAVRLGFFNIWCILSIFFL